MQDFEKLGVFYLGKEYDLDQGELLENMILYKSKNLTTHAAIIGMTGSGKTGLGIGIIEEAAIDHIPVIAIDPKGDLGNLALTFPDLRAEDFQPWVNPSEASTKGLSVEQYAEEQAALWKRGLAQWGQDGARIKKFRDAVDVTVYTPGGSAGVGVSVLRTFSAPPISVQNDRDAYRDRVQGTTTSLLSLVGLDADPLTSREHILISTIFERVWKEGRDLNLPELIMAIQNPPLEKIGVMDLENFYPAKDRFALATRLNSLLASPSFKAWLEGEPLDINRFLYTPEGKPRVSIFSIAHLSDTERMFFVAMLFNEILTWVRSQAGTSSLRALVYMDELHGYLPPVANPPSKPPLMTLLKQARAYGLGLVLATQNPVDLDYKALSNTGTWLIGRLQTERDKARVIAGLEGAAAGGNFDRRQTEKILAGLGMRLFYLHSVHEDEPLIFQTRWVLSYMAGPMTRDQIAALPSSSRPLQTVPRVEQASVASQPLQAEAASGQNTAPPVLPPQIRQVYLPATKRSNAPLVYLPGVVGVADVQYTNAKHDVSAYRRHIFHAHFAPGPVPLDWREANSLDLDISDLAEAPLAGASFSAYPQDATQAKSYDGWQRSFAQYLRTEVPLTLLRSSGLKVISEVDEDERDFRIRLKHLAHEKRDQAIEALRKKYASRINTLEDRQRRSRQAVERQGVQSRQRKLDAVVSAGTAVLAAVLGNKTVSSTSVSRVGTAVRSANRARQSGATVAQAEETLQAVSEQLAGLELELQQAVEKITSEYNILEEQLEEVTIRATAANTKVQLVSLAWSPYGQLADGRVEPLF